MTGRRLLALLSPALAVALTACAVTPPAGTHSPTPTPTVTGAPTPTTSVTEATETDLVLRGDGMGPFLFGAKQADVVDLLTDQLGEPDESSQGILCELDDHSPWAQIVSYGGLWVRYTAEDQSKKSPRTFTAWGFTLGEPFDEPLSMAEEVPLDLSFAQLKAAYPAGKLRDLGLGDDTKIFTLPNQISFVGAGRPHLVQAGDLGVCE